MRALRIAVALCALAQEPPPIRVTTTLVQVDAVVLDRSGKPVTGLTQDDFEIYEDGKPRPIRTFIGTVTTIPNSTDPNTPNAPKPAIPQPLKREDVHRTIALVVDDMKMSFESLHFAREALRKFIAQQLAPGDLVAVLSTSSSIGGLGQFTNDPKLLRAAIDRLRPTLTGGPSSAVQPIGKGEGDDPQTASLLRRRFAVGTLGSIRHIAEGMKDMPGRKSVILVSESMRMTKDFAKEEPPVDVNEVRRVSDAANRSAVTIYALDPRGVIYPGLQAADDVQGLENAEVLDAFSERQEKIRGAQNTIRFLAGETGGSAHLNSNDLTGELRKILDSQSGYYLLGFQPGEDAAERMKKEGKYHRLQVKVKRPGLTVRYRKGYLGESSTQNKEPRNPAERLLSALASPFSSTALPLRFTPVFNRATVKALLHIPGSSVTFSEPKDGYQSATVHIIAVTEGDDPKATSSTQKSFAIRVKPEALERQSQGGFVYTLEHEIKRPGPYQMRIAVLDELSGRTGTASHFIEVPDVAKGKLALSGITMAEGDARSAEAQPDDLSPAVRVFQRGKVFSYGVTVYNAKQAELEPRLIRDGQVVWQGKRIPVVHPAGLAGGILNLSEKTTPGEYILELTAVGTQQSQWIDFELR